MEQSPHIIQVFLLDDHEIVRRGVRELLESEPDIEVVGEASTAAEALQRIPAVRPHVAVLDVRLPDGSGVEVCRDVRSQLPGLACLMLTSFSDDDALFEAIMAGASGYVLKQIRGNDLITAIRRVARGESLLDPTVTAKVLHRLRHPSEEDERLAKLTPQERKILDLIAEGATNRQIGTELHLAEKTVKNYVSNMLMKLGMSRRTEAAVFAVKASINRESDLPRPPTAALIAQRSTGTCQRTVVPVPSTEVTVHVPSSRAARSCMLSNPLPRRWLLGMPLPSSLITTPRRSPMWLSDTSTRFARAWRATLLSASRTTAATSPVTS